MHTKQNKEAFWSIWKEVLTNRTFFTIMGWFFYPFIQRTKVREKVYNDTYSKWTRILWFMMNDDEVGKNGEYDFDVRMVLEKKNYNLSTRWGRFRASYWFNALRNPAYNYILTYSPVDVNGSYANAVAVVDEVYMNGKLVNPLSHRAEWEITDGKIDWEKSKVGEGEVWYHPNYDRTVSQCRYSKAWRKKFLFWWFYLTYQKGEWGGGGKYDVKFKIHTEKIK